ncbi:MAG: hypothetical protein IKP47_05920 [Ruminococcus sp.]|nr:hypothetical protein [Ruminococcus sp.]
MENNNDKLAELNIERAKALFEYEMTAVLLAAAEEKEAQQNLLNEYLEMEIDKPEVVFGAPEFKAEGVGYEAPGEIRAPEFTAPEAEKFDGLEDYREPESFTLPGMPGAADPRKAVAAVFPKEAAAAEAFDAGKLSAAAEVKELPKVSVSAAEIPAGFKPLDADMAGSVPEVKAPETGVGAVPGIEIPELPAAAAVSAVDTGLDVNAGKAGVGFEAPACEVSVEAEVPDTAADMTVFAIAPVVMTEIKAAVDLSGAEALAKGGAGMFKLPEAQPVSVSVNYVPAEPVSFELADIPHEKAAAPVYPEIPDKPDITAAVDEILEAVRAEL